MSNLGHQDGRVTAAAVGAGALGVGVGFGLVAAAPAAPRMGAAAGLAAVLLVWTPLTMYLLVRARRLKLASTTLEVELARRSAPEVLALNKLEHDIAAVRAVIDGEEVAIVLQPIVWLPTNEIVGYEALARFSDGAPPPAWFERAQAAGLGIDLELCCARLALECLDVLPGEAYLSINASPETLLSAELGALLHRPESHRVVIELTEHVSLGAYESYIVAVDRLRSLGVRLAVDDAGAGFSSLRHVVSLGPDIVKLDRSLVAQIDSDQLRRSLVHGLASFARATKTSLVAEGVETEEEALTLVEEGVAFGQGFWFARPEPALAFQGLTVVGQPIIDLRGSA